MNFESWWADLGQRTIAFDARGFAEAGWKGYELHAGEMIDADVPLIEDAPHVLESKDVVIAHLAAGVTIGPESADDLIHESERLGRALTKEESSAILAPLIKQEGRNCSFKSFSEYNPSICKRCGKDLCDHNITQS